VKVQTASVQCVCGLAGSSWSGFSGSCPHVKMAGLDAHSAQCSPGGTGTGTLSPTYQPYRQRLAGLGGMDAGDVGWRGCDVESTIAAVMDEGGQKQRAMHPPGRPAGF
jgi:hypothetical protein